MINALSARNLALAQKYNVNNLITLCGSCTYITKKTQIALENENRLIKINQILKENDLEYKKDKLLTILHIIELLNQPEMYNKLKEKLEFTLDLKVAIQKPCMIFRPSRINIDQNPDLIGNLLDLCGVKLVDYSYMDRCCGGTMLAFDESIGKELANQRYNELNKIKPDFIVTSCPNCHLVYSIYPKVVGTKIIPSLFLTQIIGLCLGFSFEEVALSRNVEKDVIFKKIDKYLKPI
jgi:succinate dehydrogenase / fumarate reductase cytochrome b subunit